MTNGENNKKSDGIRLIEKGKRGFFHLIFSRLGLIVVLLLLNFLLLFAAFAWFGQLLPHIYGGVAVFTVVMVIYLLNSGMDPTAKITWLVVVMLMPVFGSLLYVFIRNDIGHRQLKKRLQKLGDDTSDMIMQDADSANALESVDPLARSLTKYAAGRGCHPVYTATDVKYFPSGEAKFESMLETLAGAEHFIFMEYFIIEEGVMWGRILDVLAEKAKAGVDVRVMYDGTCEFSTLPHDYPKRLAALGIKCKMFAPVSPVVSTHYNYRDHRKILVVDGKVAFNGGVNLADEYINAIVKHGHWKDVAVKITGGAVRSFTLMFLQMWNIDERSPDFSQCLTEPPKTDSHGFVMPFGDSPLDNDKVGERVYMSILERAKRYVHIMTPYLILDGELETALKFAAERGVDVEIILPGIPDKNAPYALAKTHYKSLLESGVRILEYTPGFVHAKVFVSDDAEAVVGTINLDYRSLYHHFECATWMYGTSAVADIEADFEKTREKCRVVTKDTVWDGYKRLRPFGAVIKAIAPLL